MLDSGTYKYYAIGDDGNKALKGALVVDGQTAKVSYDPNGIMKSMFGGAEVDARSAEGVMRSVNRNHYAVFVREDSLSNSMKKTEGSLGSHMIFSAENSPYPDKVKGKATHEQVLEFLKSKGEDAVEVQGHYGSPERSILVRNPKKPDRIKRIAHGLGQESIIHSDGKNHRMEYLHGPNAGKHARGTGTVWHQSKPKDFYTTMDGKHFTHNFDFDRLYDHERA
jgi:hypothetical protein